MKTTAYLCEYILVSYRNVIECLSCSHHAQRNQVHINIVTIVHFGMKQFLNTWYQNVKNCRQSKDVRWHLRTHGNLGPWWLRGLSIGVVITYEDKKFIVDEVYASSIAFSLIITKRKKKQTKSYSFLVNLLSMEYRILGCASCIPYLNLSVYCWIL